MKRTIQKAGLFITAAGSAIGAFATTVEFFSHYDYDMFIPMGILGSMTYLSVRTLKRVNKKALEESSAREEQKILRYVMDHGNLVTPTELAIEMGIGIANAKDKLDELNQMGALDLEVTEEGKLLYKLSNYLSLEDKYLAQLKSNF